MTWSRNGPNLLNSARPQVGSYLRYISRDASQPPRSRADQAIIRLFGRLAAAIHKFRDCSRPPNRRTAVSIRASVFPQRPAPVLVIESQSRCPCAIFPKGRKCFTLKNRAHRKANRNTKVAARMFAIDHLEVLSGASSGKLNYRARW
jgi:hypothetical protein